jgi:kynurenine formamidase
MTSFEEFEAIAEKVSNWGRWGEDDQIGTLNLVTPEVRRRAAASVLTGQAVPLSLVFSANGVQVQDGRGVPGRINPVRTMLATNLPMGPDPAVAYSDDIVVTPLQAATHWDALSHVSWRGQMYNGVPADAVDYAGAHKLSMDKVESIVTRGVLLDVARHQGVDSLPGGFEVTADLLRATEQSQGSEVLPGDAVLVRTGQMRHFLAGDLARYSSPNSGLGPDCALYFKERDVSAVGIDTRSFDLTTPLTVPEVVLPSHVLCLVMLGLHAGQNFVLEQLGEHCAEENRYHFLLDASPLRFERSTGGPVNAVAVL